MPLTADWIARCEAALAASGQRAPSPHLAEAIAHLRGGEVAPASAAVAPLADEVLLLSTMYLERLAVHLGLEQAQIVALGAPVAERLAPEALDTFGFVDRAWMAGWSDAVEGLLPPERVGERAGLGIACVALGKAAREACARGDLEQALALAESIRPHHKAQRGVALAEVGVRLPEPRGGALLLTAVKTAGASPMIQEGGEEASALGAVVKVMAEQGVAADHPAVEAAFKALLRLGRKRARKDGRSFGLRDAGVAAARAASRGEAAWLDRASALVPSIWSDRLAWPVTLWSAVALRALDRKAEGDALFAELPDEAFPSAALKGLYPAQPEALEALWEGGSRPLDVARALVAAGEDPSAALDEAEVEAGRWYRGRHTLYVALRGIDEARAAACLQSMDPAERLDARAIVASAVELEAVIAEGWLPSRVGLYLPRLARAQLDVLEGRMDRLADTHDRLLGLSGIAEGHLRAGDWARAAQTLALAASAAPIDAEPEWIPYYRRGSRGERRPGPSLDVVKPIEADFEADFEAALASAMEVEGKARLGALYALMKRSDAVDLPTLLPRLKKATSGRGRDEQVMKRGMVAHACLRLDDVDAALDEATRMRDCRRSGWGPAYTARLIGEWLERHPEAITLARAERLMTVYDQAIPQDIPDSLLRVAPVLLAGLDEAGAARVRSAMDALRGQFRPADQAAFDAALAVGCALVGDARGAQSWLTRALAAAKEGGAIYLKPVTLVESILRAHAATPLSGRDGLLGRALRLFREGRAYEIAMGLERALLHLWKGGAAHLLLARLESGALPTEVEEAVRRSWLVEAPAHAPDPVTAVAAVWQKAPPNRARALEQIRCLAEAFEAQGADASELRALGD